MLHDNTVIPFAPRRAQVRRESQDVPEELAWLRRRVDAQDRALAHLSEALSVMRRGGEALRAENRELRGQLEAARLQRRGASA